MDEQKMRIRHQNMIHDSEEETSSPSDPPDFFQFFTHLNSEMCAAEDVIYCGKLVPFKDKPPSASTPETLINNEEEEERDKKPAPNGFRKRSESLSEIPSPVTRSNSIQNALMRNSKSLDYRKLRRPPQVERNSSVKSVGKSDSSVKKTRPRWFFLMFGMVKFPAEMELSDIKTRQTRQNPSSFFPPKDNGRNFPGKRKGSSKLLRALSCKNDASVAVTTPYFTPHV